MLERDSDKSIFICFLHGSERMDAQQIGRRHTETRIVREVWRMNAVPLA
jgi:hypothetical protein